MDLTTCPQCGNAAEITERDVLESTDGPVEHAKVGATDFARIAGLDAVDVVVMDEATPAIAELCEGHGIDLVAATGVR